MFIELSNCSMISGLLWKTVIIVWVIVKVHNRRHIVTVAACRSSSNSKHKSSKTEIKMLLEGTAKVCICMLWRVDTIARC